MLWNVAADLFKLGLITLCTYALVRAYARLRKPHWAAHLTRRRLAVLGLLTLAVAGIKLVEDVVAKESGPVDEAILWFVRQHVPAALNGFFAAATLGGSARVLVPVAVLASAVFWFTRRRFEALLLGASLLASALVVWGMKAIVGRARPAFWEAEQYGGSSFPSGHTLSTAAFSTALALSVARIWPRAGGVAMALALLWTGLVAVSRLVLGVHWPSDVLAALCIGAFIALFISVAFDPSHQHAGSAIRGG